MSCNSVSAADGSQTSFKIVVYDADPARAGALEAGLYGVDGVEVVRKPARELWQHSGVDAIYVSIPMAEKWGARPVLYEVQVLPTSDNERAQGFPAYVIAGLATDGEDRRAPADLLSLVLKTTLDAVEHFNSLHRSGIRVIGFMPQHLLSGQLDGFTIGDRLRVALARATS